MEPVILPRVSDQKPLVTVITITYNHEPYIRDCIEGVLMQKTSFPVEYLIHDDASKDHTADIIREYYEKRPDQIHAILQTVNHKFRNTPVFAPLLKMARGEYIALCEGDDYWIDPHKLQQQIDFITTHTDCSCCFHNSIRKDMMKNGSETLQHGKQKNRYYSLADIIALDGGFMNTASMLFRKEAIAQYEFYRSNCPVGDYPLAICAAQNGKVYYLDTPMSVYRLNVPTGWTRTKTNEKMIGIYERIINWLQHIKAITKEEEASDFILSKYYFRLFSLTGDRDGLKSNMYCKRMYDRLPVTEKILWFFSVRFITVFSHLESKNIIRRVVNKFVLKRILEKDVWKQSETKE